MKLKILHLSLSKAVRALKIIFDQFSWAYFNFHIISGFFFQVPQLQESPLLTSPPGVAADPLKPTDKSATKRSSSKVNRFKIQILQLFLKKWQPCRPSKTVVLSTARYKQFTPAVFIERPAQSILLTFGLYLICYLIVQDLSKNSLAKFMIFEEVLKIHENLANFQVFPEITRNSVSLDVGSLFQSSEVFQNF